MRLAPKDAIAYRSLMLQGYVESADAFTSTVRERGALPLGSWERRLEPFAGSGDVVFGEFRENALTGVIGLSLNDSDKTCHKARLFGMYVHPDFRSQGIAAALLAEALAFAAAKPTLREIQLTVTKGNIKALILYERAGFVAWGIEPRAISSKRGYLNKIHMHRAVG